MTGDSFTVDGIVYKQISTTYGTNCVEVSYDTDKFTKDPNTGKYVGTTYSGDVTIPATVLYNNVTYNVTEIGTDAFNGSQSLTSVVLPSSIKVIGIQAFRNCPNLSSINFPEGLETIYYDAFTYDSSLTEIVLPSSLKLIDGYAFCECRGLKRVILSDSDTPLQKPQYYGSSAIFSQINVDYAYIGRAGADVPVKIDTKELVLGNAITKVSEDSFNPETLEKITIPASVTIINNGAFANATALKEAILEDGANDISLYYSQASPSNSTVYLSCFENTQLQNLYVGRNVAKVYYNGHNDFSFVKTLKNVTFGPSVTKLADYEFLRCEGLESVDFSKSSITSIGSGCFSDNYELTSVVLPSGLTAISERAFDSCLKLSSIVIPNGVVSIGKTAFDYNSCEEITLPSSVESIDTYAFAGCKQLKTLNLNEGLQTISSNAFAYCTSLEELTIPSTVTSISDCAFQGLTSLRKLTFSDSSTDLTLNPNTSNMPPFYESGDALEEVYIGRKFVASGSNSSYSLFRASSYTNDIKSSPVVSFGTKIDATSPYTFYSFLNISKIICYGKSPIPYYYSKTFPSNVLSNTKVYVPQGYVDQYNENGWDVFTTVVENIKPTRVSLNKTSLSLRKGETYSLTATVYPSNASDQDLVWTSSDESILTVSDTGSVVAVGIGEATVKATLKEYPNLSASCKFKVTAPLASTIEFSSETTNVFVGSSNEITVNISPNDASNDFSLSVESIDDQSTDIISVSTTDNKITIKGISTGSVKLVATTTDGSNLSTSCIVNVCSISFQDRNIVLGKGASYNLVPIITPSLDSNISFVWNSSNTDVATVSENGTITTKKSGTATITCYPVGNENSSITCDVEVGILFDKNLLVEATVSTQVSYSVRGYAGLEMYKSLSVENSDAKIIPIAIHTDFNKTDPMTVSDYSSNILELVPAIPQFLYDRSSKAEGPTSVNRTMFYPETAKYLLSKKSTFGLEITSVNSPDNPASDMQLTANIGVYPGRNCSDNFKIAAVIIENDVTNVAAQDNSTYYTYSSDQVDEYDWQWMSPYCSNGTYGTKTIPASSMVYQNVARGVFPSFEGKDLGNSWSEGSCCPASISFNLPSNIQNLANCELVVMLLDSKGRVVNAAAMPYSQFNVQTSVITGLNLNKSAITLENGKSETLTATVTPSYIENPAIQWTSANPEIATVSDGVITATGVGTTTITVSTTDGSNLSQSCSVSVYPSSIAFNESEISLFENETFQLVPNIPDEYLKDATFLWSSSNYGIINVDQTGLVTAISKGQAKATLKIWTPSATITADCYVTVNRIATKIALSQSEATIEVGNEIQLNATLQPTDVYVTSVDWTSSDENVATVDSNGIVHGLTQGTTIITASTTDGSKLSSSCNVKVVKLVSVISLNETEATLNEGQTVQLVATVTPELADNKSLTWTSSDKSVAKVDQSGLVTAVAPGTATITAATTDGSDISASCTITVRRYVSEIVLSNSELSMSAGEYKILEVSVLPSNATIPTLNWESSNSNVARVENGVIFALSDGEATITASSTDGSNISASCHVIVRTLVSQIILDQTDITLKVGEFKNLNAIVYPDNATNSTLEWTSSDESVASVQNGLVLAHSEGTVTITAHATDDSSVTAECIVNVTDDAGVDNISLDGVSIYVANSTIYCKNVPVNTIVRIYQLDGTELFAGESDGNIVSFQPANRGMYIVVVRNLSEKVVVR